MANQSKLEALTRFFEAIDGLRDQGIVINQKDFTGQLGEWLVEVILNGKRATNACQGGWDVDVNGCRVQVKTHAKDDTNRTAWTSLANPSSEIADELIIIVFTKTYKLKAFYRVPWDQAVSLIRTTTARKNDREIIRHKIHWKDIVMYSQDIGMLPKQDIISFFKL
ncbi:hypothetical protein [Parapedobacter indicus]|uniref:Uncharacterized protein n=1 Tax=Parapedobacter indicus TaxID=1477437 RepID=A0A1I3CJL4_9SPHI|nr:hypothetical protein [Parapedobacter indicus]PPL04273.1 hypothetical protein CLV26_10174 [Parapedobacter indicus]SFH74618.1 hypothetical protein SAMN05444682_10161 [Parapedobacter indicus]